MKIHELKEKLREIIDENDYEKSNVSITRYNNTVNVSFERTYSYVEFSFQMLNKISKLFKTEKRITMKKKLSLMFALVILLFSSLALAWRADANVVVNALHVNATVYNQLPVPIVCKGKVFGRVRTGHVGHAWFNGVIPPGASAYTYVRTNVHNPFIDGWANIQCQTLR